MGGTTTGSVNAKIFYEGAALLFSSTIWLCLEIALCSARAQCICDLRGPHLAEYSIYSWHPLQLSNVKHTLECIPTAVCSTVTIIHSSGMYKLFCAGFCSLEHSGRKRKGESLKFSIFNYFLGIQEINIRKLRKD